jgi:hypothetical protein
MTATFPKFFKQPAAKFTTIDATHWKCRASDTSSADIVINLAEESRFRKRALQQRTRPSAG